jgi:hypothetical protein
MGREGFRSLKDELRLMTNANPPIIEDDDGGPRLGWKGLIFAAVFYVGCVAVATYPLVTTFATTLPGSLLDPLQHLWIMRWYKTCLLEGRSPLVCPEVMYPVGAPLGNYSPLHFQALLYIPLSSLIHNDILCFNLIWLFGMVTTGLGSFLLIWQVVRDRKCALLGGLLAMLSGPMMLHCRAHLELIHVGCFPLFLVAWLRFVDAPTRRRLALAVAAYVLVALCAAYYVVFAAVPATLYVVWSALRGGWAGIWPFVRTRAGWLVVFAASVVPSLVLVFANHLWAIKGGYSITRPMSEFEAYGAPLWTYLVPTALHRLYALLPFNFHTAADFKWTVGERASYLGVVSLGLVYYAAARRVQFARSSFWWLVLGSLVILSCGAFWVVGPLKIGLPAYWLKKNLFIFRMIRVPARFNLFVGVAAGLVAAAGLKHLLDRLRWRWTRGLAFAALTALALFDLSTVPFETETVPEMPACYDYMKKHAPGAAFVEIPQFSSGGSHLYSICSYWQSLHRGLTNASYAGHGNIRYDDLVTWNSPFLATNLAKPGYPGDPSTVVVDVVINVDYYDYVWLYLQTHGYRFVVLHQWVGALADISSWTGSKPDDPVSHDTIKELLEPALVYEDGMTAVYDRAKLPVPAHAVLLTTTGWRPCFEPKLFKPIRATQRVANLKVYNPDPSKLYKFVLDGASMRNPRSVRLMAGGRELGHWEVAPRSYGLYVTEPFRLPAGTSDLAIVSDAEDRPIHKREFAFEWDKLPYSIRVSGVALIDGEEPRPAPPQVAERAADEPAARR